MHGAAASGPPDTGAGQGMRADKWLWHARFFKTRGLAAKVISAGHLRVNGDKALKPARNVTPGDVLTFPQARVVRVVKILAMSQRRGPAPEAQALYEDMTPEEPPVPKNPAYEGKGRPGGKDRRKAREFDRSQLE